MTKSTLLLVFLMLTFSAFNWSRPAQTEQSHTMWLEERYVEATTVKEGMTRADLVKLFGVDGGLQKLLPGRYVLKSCSMIKVDVEFDVPEAAQSKTIIPEDLRHESLAEDKYEFVPNEKLKIKNISRPYLEPAYYD